MNEECKNYLKNSYNIDVDNLSSEELTEILIETIKKNEELIRLAEEKINILENDK